MRVYKKKAIRRMKWYGVILVLASIPLGIGMGRSLEERTRIRKGRDLQAPTSCVDAVGRISGRSDREKGKGRTGGSIGR